MLDKYFFGEAKRLSPEAPVPVLHKTKETMVLGGAANVARNLVRAIQDVSIMSVIGNDNEGKLLKNILEENKIHTDLLILDKTRTTTVKTRMIGPNNSQMLRLDVEDTNQISDEIISRIQKNNWNNNNIYIYVITEINKTQLQNFLSMTSICKGVAIDLYKYDNAIKIINDYAMDLNYLFYVNAAIPMEELEKND